MSPLVSIVIPTYNRERDLERALRSVISQTHAEWEAIVVDNHSTDGTAQMVHSLGDGRISLHRIHNEGIIAASRNLGVCLARGEHVAFLDSDDWWTPEKLGLAVAALERGADVVYHDLFLVRRKGQRQFSPSGTVRPVVAPVFEDLLRSGNALANSSVVVRAGLLGDIGSLKEDRNLIGMEDFDAWLRLARRSDRFVMLPETLGYYWAGGGNTTNPERTLRALAAFEAIYGKEAAVSSGHANWLSYARGRALYRLGRFSEARSELKKIPIYKVAPKLALKVGYMSIRAGLGR